MPYQFELQKGGEFVINTRYAALWQSEFSIEAIVKAEPYSDNEGSSNGSDNSTEEGGNQDDSEDGEDGGDVEKVEQISTETDEDDRGGLSEQQVNNSDSPVCPSVSVKPVKQLPGNQQAEIKKCGIQKYPDRANNRYNYIIFS